MGTTCILNAETAYWTQDAKSKFNVLDHALMKNYDATKCQRLVLKCLSEACFVCENSSTAQEQAPAVTLTKQNLPSRSVFQLYLFFF
jgi:hypothetical protein